jgi:hypothetical protein
VRIFQRMVNFTGFSIFMSISFCCILSIYFLINLQYLNPATPIFLSTLFSFIYSLFLFVLGTFFENLAKSEKFTRIQANKAAIVENNCKIKFGLLECIFSFKDDMENIENSQISCEKNEYDVDDGEEEEAEEADIREKGIMQGVNRSNVSPSANFSLQININPSSTSLSEKNSSSSRPQKYEADQATQQYHAETDGSESDQSERFVNKRSSMDQPTQQYHAEENSKEEGDLFYH